MLLLRAPLVPRPRRIGDAACDCPPSEQPPAGAFVTSFTSCVREAQLQKCAECGTGGATARCCQAGGCRRHFHLHCAAKCKVLDAGGCFLGVGAGGHGGWRLGGRFGGTVCGRAAALAACTGSLPGWLCIRSVSCSLPTCLRRRVPAAVPGARRAGRGRGLGAAQRVLPLLAHRRRQARRARRAAPRARLLACPLIRYCSLGSQAADKRVLFLPGTHLAPAGRLSWPA